MSNIISLSRKRDHYLTVIESLTVLIQDHGDLKLHPILIIMLINKDNIQKEIQAAKDQFSTIDYNQL